MTGSKFIPKTLREIKSYDIFDIPQDFFNNNKVPQDYRMKPVFNEGVIKIVTFNSFFTNENDVYYIYLNGITGDIETYIYSRENYSFCFVFKTTMNTEIKTLDRLPIYKNKKFKSVNDNAFREFVGSVIVEAMAYISYFTENKETVIKHGSHKRTTSSSISNRSEKNNGKRKIQILNKERVMYEVHTSSNELIKSLRHYQRHTEAWHVIGHKRTYKSGKVIWVKPYTKGNKNAKSNIEAKKYIIESEERK